MQMLAEVKLDCPELTELSLVRAPKLADIGFVAHLFSLRTLDLGGCRQLADLRPLAGLPIERLDVGATAIKSLDIVAELAHLQTCIAHNCRQLRKVELRTRENLRHLDLREYALSPFRLEEMPALEQLQHAKDVEPTSF